MTTLYVVLGIVAVVIFAIWMAIRNATSEGRATSQLESEKQAREVEDGMAEIGARDITDDDLLKSFRENEGR